MTLSKWASDPILGHDPIFKGHGDSISEATAEVVAYPEAGCLLIQVSWLVENNSQGIGRRAHCGLLRSHR